MYKIKISGTKELEKKLNKLSDSLSSKEFINYLGDKCERSLYKITNENLSTVEDLETSDYARNHKKEIEGNKIILSNDTMADLSELSPEKLVNYPNGFSIAKAVEYGTGIVGSSSSASSFADDWEYDVNGHGEKGWFYIKNGDLHWSKGFEGRLIFYKTSLDIKENVSKWVMDYIKEKMK